MEHGYRVTVTVRDRVGDPSLDTTYRLNPGIGHVEPDGIGPTSQTVEASISVPRRYRTTHTISECPADAVVVECGNDRVRISTWRDA